ncbi:MAG: hypothetical protein LKI94_09100 [Sporolactobacillus sp.]|jgi:hypothetical protein|nr:hypothetical protein [Sporolactobacillus sp.]MCI1882334.1 hypothetical protein [Sporolactobacillus sp.]
MNMNEKIVIDPQHFALAVLAGNPKQNDEENKVYLKKQLVLYLEALLLAQDFNDLEETQFDVSKSKKRNDILNKIIEHRYN